MRTWTHPDQRPGVPPRRVSGILFFVALAVCVVLLRMLCIFVSRVLLHLSSSVACFFPVVLFPITIRFLPVLSPRPLLLCD